MTQPTCYLVRHGSTLYTAEGRVQGQVDVPLNAQGIEEAHQAAAKLGAMLGPECIIISSDLDRAHHTARIIAQQLRAEVILDPRLRERGMGSSEGLRWSELPVDGDRDWEPAGDFEQRVLEGMRSAVALGVHEVVVVTHAGCLGVIREVVMGLPPERVRPGEVMMMDGQNLEQYLEENVIRPFPRVR